MKIVDQINLNLVLKILDKGGLVIFPSDTVYGALVDARNARAVSKLIELKNRPPGKPISVFVADLKMAQQYVFIQKNQLKTLSRLVPGPFTFILISRHKIDRRLESEKGTLGIRIPQFDPVINLVKKFNFPLTATSANLGGRPPSYSIETLLKQLPEKKKKLIDLIVDFGQLPRNKPSTVVDLVGEKIKFLRLGDIQFLNTKTYLSNSPFQTKKIASFLIKKILAKKKDKALIIILQGELGVGKTVFVKGTGLSLGIENIVSPSFVIYYEYEIEKSKTQFEDQKLYLKKLVHMDLYNIYDEEEFKSLKLEAILQPENLIMIEWGEKAGKLFNLFKQKGEVVYIKIEYLGENKRKIIIKYD